MEEAFRTRKRDSNWTGGNALLAWPIVEKIVSASGERHSAELKKGGSRSPPIDRCASPPFKPILPRFVQSAISSLPRPRRPNTDSFGPPLSPPVVHNSPLLSRSAVEEIERELRRLWIGRLGRCSFIRMHDYARRIGRRKRRNENADLGRKMWNRNRVVIGLKMCKPKKVELSLPTDRNRSAIDPTTTTTTRKRS